MYYQVLSSSTIILYWNEIPLEYRHSPITQYTLTYDVIGPEQASIVRQASATAVEYVEAYLQPGVQYLFSLSAETRVNTGPKATMLVRTDEELDQGE